MRQYFEISATRISSSGGGRAALSLRRLQEAVRQSLINLDGVTYPAMQTSSAWAWANVTEVEDGSVFTFNRQAPLAEVAFAKDLSLRCVREPLNSETGPATIFLEALVYEFIATLIFFNKVVKSVNKPGEFKVGLGTTGFAEAYVDWSGFSESTDAAGLSLINWRFRPGRDSVVFEGDSVSFPCDDFGPMRQAVTEVVRDFAFLVVGTRRTPMGNNSQSRLELTAASVDRVLGIVLDKVSRVE